MRRFSSFVLGCGLFFTCVSWAVAAVPRRSVPVARTFTSGTLKVERFGAGRGVAVIFIPALFCGSWQWNGQVAALAGRYDLYVVTLPGFDGVPARRGGVSLSTAAASLARLIDSRRLAKPIVVGHSLGGTLAVLFGETYPQKTRGIVAVEGGYPAAPTAAQRATVARRTAQPYLGASLKTFDRVLRTSMLRYTITSRADIEPVARRAERSDPTAVGEWLRAALSLDLSPGLGRMRAPFLEIVPFDANIDPYTGFRTLEAKRAAYAAWVEHAPHGSVTMIAPSRHFVMFDQPQRFDRTLFTALAALAA